MPISLVLESDQLARLGKEIAEFAHQASAALSDGPFEASLSTGILLSYGGPTSP